MTITTLSSTPTLPSTPSTPSASSTSSTSSAAPASRGAAIRLRPTRWLRGAWLVDAAGSAVTGLGMLVLSTTLAASTGLAAAFLVGSALLFAPYVALLLILARRQTVSHSAAAWPVVLNAAWGALCIGVAATQGPTALGLAFLTVHAVWGLGFAAVQLAGLRRSPAA